MIRKNIFLLAVLCVNASFAISAQSQKSKNNKMNEIVQGKSASWALPDWCDTVAGVSTAVLVGMMESRYFQPFSGQSYVNTSEELFWGGAMCLPILVAGGWVFFELRQYTSSGLYNRAKRLLGQIDSFKSADVSFDSIEHYMHYLSYHGSAKELSLVNDEYQYVAAHKFLSVLLQELTYALRLLERSKVWASASAFLGEVDTQMFRVRTKINNVKNNKNLFDSSQLYHLQYEKYQAELHLANQEQITAVVEEQHALARIKFVFKTVGNIIKFLFGSVQNKK